MNVVVEKLVFRSRHHKLTQRFVDHIEQVLCSKMFTVADVARLFDLDYGTVYKIDHEVLLRLVQGLKIPDPINIAVDEKSFKKGTTTSPLLPTVIRRKLSGFQRGIKRSRSISSFGFWEKIVVQK